MARIVVKIAKLAGLYQKPKASEMRRIGEEIADFVRKRTRSGLDENRKRFAPYAGTKEVTIQGRTAKGRFTRGKRVLRNFSGRVKRNGQPYGTKVDLTDMGDLLDKLEPRRVTDSKVEVGWWSASLQKIAEYHDLGTRYMPQRKFMGVPKSRIKAIVDSVYRPVKK